MKVYISTLKNLRPTFFKTITDMQIGDDATWVETSNEKEVEMLIQHGFELLVSTSDMYTIESSSVTSILIYP